MLPFKTKPPVVKVENIPGVEGFVFLRLWSIGEFDKQIKPILASIGGANELDGLSKMKAVIASSVAMDDKGELAFTKQPVDDNKQPVGAPIPDPDHAALVDLPMPLATGLFKAILRECGPGDLESEKNDSTTTPASG